MGQRPQAQTGSQADRQLIDALAQRGVEVSPSQLKRWRAAGLLPTPQRTARGRGRGRTSDSYPAGTADRAAAVAELVARRTPLREVALHLFVRGYDVEGPVVAAAYQELLQWLRGLTSSAEDPADAMAQALRPRAKRHPLGRKWIRRAGTYGARRGSVVEDALVALTTLVLTDDEPSGEAMKALSLAAGATDPEPFANAVAEFSIAGLETALKGATSDDLAQAREIYFRSMDLIEQLAYLQAVTGAEILPYGLTDQPTSNEFNDIIGVLAIVEKLDGRSDYEAQLNEVEAAVNDAKSALSAPMSKRAGNP